MASLLRPDAGVLREGGGEGEAQGAPVAQPVDGPERRGDRAAGTELAGAGTTYFFAAGFLAAF